MVANAHSVLLSSLGLKNRIRDTQPCVRSAQSAESLEPNLAKDQATVERHWELRVLMFSDTRRVTLSITAGSGRRHTANAQIKLAISCGLNDGNKHNDIAPIPSRSSRDKAPSDAKAQAALARSCWLKDCRCLTQREWISSTKPACLNLRVARAHAVLVSACGLNESSFSRHAVLNASNTGSAPAASIFMVPSAHMVLARPWAAKLRAFCRINSINSFQSSVCTMPLGSFLDHLAIR
mmetsp:Transcript_44270/g.96306  ORF Transcript_44270/g.96306 Transcript_44270/m.96306 type:complete len:237 (+) Transcript_44270:508-1218(+)